MPAGTVLLVDALKTGRAQLFTAPCRILACRELAEVPAFLAELEAARQGGGHLAGFFAYEFGFAFEPKLAASHHNTDELLAWFGVYDAPQELALAEVFALLAQASGGADAGVSGFTYDMDRLRYAEAFAAVQHHLAVGDIYQANLTMRARFAHHGPVEAQFARLLGRQPVPYAAFIKLEDRAILSLSPELFLERKGEVLRTRPMKGTAPRGRDTAEDAAIAAGLASDPKQRAENVMIADLMRNDLSRVTEAGSVAVHDVFAVERYRSLHQMVTGVSGRLLPGMELPAIIEGLFPCGSITGAPKLSAMQIIRAQETGPRGVYTGSIGTIAPSGDFSFNVAIRTLVLKEDGTGEAGIGSGVVFDSGAAPEYDECLLKLRFLTAPDESFELIETLGWTPEDGYLLFARHLARLTDSARYFGFACDPGCIKEQLEELAKGFTGPQRVRLLLAADGTVTLTHADFVPTAAGEVWPVTLSPARTSAEDRFFFHKTTRRALYDESLKTAMAAGFKEILFENEQGFLTEGSFTNLFIARNGRLLTPALKHGVLPGTLRAALLDKRLAAEADLTRADLVSGAPVYVGNSLRGLVRVKLALPEEKA
jgi:para-aminobenzoate synthetase/4-amino-4-deoxychorismate lyase